MKIKNKAVIEEPLLPRLFSNTVFQYYFPTMIALPDHQVFVDIGRSTGSQVITTFTFPILFLAPVVLNIILCIQLRGQLR